MHTTEVRDVLERTGSPDDLRRVVVGVGDSPSGRSALLWALREAHARGVPLLAVRAWTPRSELFDEPGPRLVARTSAQARDAQDYVDQDLELAVTQTGLHELEQAARAIEGSPAEVLLEAGRDGMIVVGTRGTGRLARHVVGSTTAAVLHHASSSVVVVPPGPPNTSGRAPRVLVGVDHSAESLRALEVAAATARRYGHPLVPVFAYQPPLGDMSGVGMYLSDPQPVREAATAALREAVEAVGCADVVVAPEVALGHAGHALTTLARPQDLLVVGSRGRGGFAALLLGSTSTSCAQHATCPVLVVR